MNLDLGSFMFKVSTGNSGKTPSWGTALGQGVGYKYSVDPSKELYVSMLYNQIPTEGIDPDTGERISRLSGAFGKGGRKSPDVVVASLFKKVFVNGTLIRNGEYILLISKEHSRNHNGRCSLKYNSSITYDGVNINEKCLSLIRESLQISENAAWLICEINFANQDELHFTACVVNDEPLYFQDVKRRNAKLLECIGSHYKEIASVPGQIHHYTSLEGAIAIIKGIKNENGRWYFEMRASRRDCLNDPHECSYGKSVIEKFYGINDIQIYPYIISFCKANDNPLMWRLYQAKIQFDFSGEDIKSYLRSMTDPGVDYICNDVKYYDLNKIGSVRELSKLLSFGFCGPQSVAFVKHVDYSVEREWRIAVFEEAAASVNNKDGADSRYDCIRLFKHVKIPLEALQGIAINEPNIARYEVLKRQLVALLSRNGSGIDFERIIRRTSCAAVR